jgi:hypothetical protein
MSYTKGPLVYVPGSYQNYIKTDEDSNYTVVASLDLWSFANEEARERLGLAMAAAPDLLEAAKNMMLKSASPDPQDWSDALDMLDAAIAKAEPACVSRMDKSEAQEPGKSC